MILYTHLFEIRANTIPSMDREPNKTIANVKFAFGPLRMKNAMMLSTTITIDKTPNLFKFEASSNPLYYGYDPAGGMTPVKSKINSTNPTSRNRAEAVKTGPFLKTNGSLFMINPVCPLI